ncbi:MULTISPECIES: tRNA guanosine(34) transglycosylase Tgt [unclassified Mesotoga]|uniref:Queuine tRNA-ribosyltransferase n=1 Tax=Mesotoga prima TaxID=1184387 RepID=A0A101HRY5_9BACT|nr:MULTISPECIES: tRNA guanosine(34) transglycosylase Tgt [unclassified Mesotoga]KUK81935.1 MAG: Queuine tRNA-ribosyltransferase [Mesotoga prima]RAM58881.1 queuine tRNA-ribosyltransferase [Mesotoga sp. SC_4PWL113PWK15]PNS42274.1 queuine tRNA-ribosyltransferase [Mesotoga sp. B105.6.4]PVD15748.1 queuine tRNA-ribosyltransferase [Mesotoga sp. Brook.08.105.5.1]RAO97770.1 queuine tRNA-ribosyltransferase [Mesotoga sp. Brook.08.YT.4.2.5.4.]
MVELSIRASSTESKARTGIISTPHGEFDTPVFMPVGTNGTVKGIWQDQLHELEARIILGNAFHLFLRPGLDILRDFGGLHKFMSWGHSILTDSGGFQVFSLKDKKVSDEGVKFRSPLDGRSLFVTPELSMEIQEAVGSDIAMAFDECTEPSATKEYVRNSVNRTTAWAKRFLIAHRRNSKQSFFGVVQGGFFNDLREESASQITAMDFDGFALGGLSVGEDFETTERVLSSSVEFLPEDRPRYLMGVGTPELIMVAVENGVDMFDSVLPTRLGRHGAALTSRGRVNLKSARNKLDRSPVDPFCQCKVCSTYSKAYIHHLFTRDEILGKTLLSYHNISFLMQFVKKIREAILEDRLAEFKNYCLETGLIQAVNPKTSEERMG